MKRLFNNITAKVKSFFCVAYFPFIVYGIIMLAVHLQLKLGWADDALFITYLEDASLFSVLGARYREWSSSILIEAILFPLVHVPFLWRILDTLIMLWIVIALSLFFNSEQRTSVNWAIVFIVLAFPLGSMSTAGWIATTLNYSWPLAFGLLALFPIVNQVRKKKTPIWLFVASIFALLFASNQEQMGAVMFAICGMLSVYLWRRDKKFPKFPVIQTGICAVALIFILTCPGNSARMEANIAYWFPSFSELSMFRKIELGYSSSLYEFIMKPNLIFTIFGVILTTTVFVNSKKLSYRIISCIPLTASLLFGMLSSSEVLSTWFPQLLDLRNKVTAVGTGIQLASPITWVPDIVITLIFFSALISLWGAFENKEEAGLSIFLLLVGLASRMIMGFSPTIWASGDRTFIFMYFSFIAVSILLFTRARENFLKKKTAKIVLALGIGIFSLFIADELLFYINFY